MISDYDNTGRLLGCRFEADRDEGDDLGDKDCYEEEPNEGLQ